MSDASLLRDLCRERGRTLVAAMEADMYRVIALSAASKGGAMMEALEQVARVHADLQTLLGGAVDLPMRAALEKATADLAAAQVTADGRLPPDEWRRIERETRSAVEQAHANLMAAAWPGSEP